MRAGIVGGGFVSRVHASALAQLRVELVGVWGRDDDLGAMLDAARPDVLHVCTPNALHAEQALAALERGIHVVCEKPLAVTSEESVRMVEAAAHAGLVGATCYHVRGYPLVDRMRAAVGAGELGDVRVVHGRYLCDDVLHGDAGWRTRPESSGPSYVVADLGTHWLDLAGHVTGLRVLEVLAQFRGQPLEDYAALLLRLENDVSGSLLLSAGAAGRKNQLLFECEGSRGGLSWDQERPDELLHRHAERPTELVLKDPATSPLARFPAGHAEGYGDAFANLFREIYRAIA
ncbi:MAG TPA: Gfo/Idh/MocA family oxidoreductase, partial [Gaiellaceae bacterium]